MRGSKPANFRCFRSPAPVRAGGIGQTLTGGLPTPHRSCAGSDSQCRISIKQQHMWPL